MYIYIYIVWCVNWTHVIGVIGNLAKLFQMQLATSKNFQERLMTHWLVGRRASKSSRVYPFRPPLHQFWESKLHLHLLLRLVVYPVPQFHRVKTVSCSYMFSVSCLAFVIHPNCLEMFSPKFPQKLDTFFFEFFSPKREDFLTTNLEAFGLPYRATTSTIPGVGDSAKTTNQWGWIVRIFSKNKDVLWTWTNLGRALHTHDEVWVLFLRTSTQRPCSMLGTILANPGEDFSVENRDFFAMAFGRPHLISWKTYLLSTEWDGPNDDSLLSKKRLWQCPTHATETWNELLWRKS